MMTAGMYSSKTPEWATPQSFFDALNKEFRFTLDPCATKQNAKCGRFFTEQDDGLNKKWTGRVFMNPPYGRGIGAWVKKAYESAMGGRPSYVCFLPVLIRRGGMTIA
jgi:phage N-6-adenine-methyltransferase